MATESASVKRCVSPHSESIVVAITLSATVFRNMPFECGTSLFHKLLGLLREYSDCFVLAFGQHAGPTIQYLQGATVIRRRKRIGAGQLFFFPARGLRSGCPHFNPVKERLTHLQSRHKEDVVNRCTGRHKKAPFASIRLVKAGLIRTDRTSRCGTRHLMPAGHITV
jgi:hypothetical protein